MSDDVKAARERVLEWSRLDWLGREKLYGQLLRPEDAGAIYRPYERDVFLLAKEYIRLTAALPAFVRRCVEAGADMEVDIAVCHPDSPKCASAYRNAELDRLAADLAAELAGGKPT